MREEYDFTDGKNSPYAERFAKEQPEYVPEVDRERCASGSR